MPPRTRKPETVTTALARLLTKVLLPDLGERSKLPSVLTALQAQHESERAAKKTGATFIDWREQLLDQVAAAWALSCVFVRTLEDRGLLDQRRLAGPGADDSLQLFYELAPNLGPREYLLTVFREVARSPGAEDLLGPTHNAAWRLGLSQTAAQALHDFFKERDEAGELRWQFTGEDTRFLGDLYQDLSESVKERYALLQTPEFVESFILDRTLTPAIAEFGLETVKVLDPTCGSGHFLLGAFERLFDRRLAATPGAERKAVALAALGQVYGVDINPYAIAIARFRLMLRFLQVTGVGKLREAPRELACNLVVADSLLIEGGRANVEAGELFADDAGWGKGFESFRLDEPDAARRLLRDRYHVVVGNPPYIVCNDPVLNKEYRTRYVSCHMQYSLGAPFTERLFQLSADNAFVGQITSNSFMKREFGQALIEQVLPHVDLTHIIDTAGAYIPGHGTPTVILVGRNRPPRGDRLVAVEGKRSEPSTPEDPAIGKVWTSILTACAGEPATLETTVPNEYWFEDEFVSCGAVLREAFSQHPWILAGGGARELKGTLDESAATKVGSVSIAIGRTTHTGEDDAFIVRTSFARQIADNERYVPLVKGEEVRDYSLTPVESCLFPYDRRTLQASWPDRFSEQRYWWMLRVVLRRRKDYGQTPEQRGLKWFEQSMFFAERFRSPLSIAFAFVATHNHFVLDRGAKVFKQSAPVIKLPADASEDDHLALLGLLNSSVACFWMKQVFYPKSGSGIGRGVQAEAWMDRFEFDATKLAEFPIVVTSKSAIKFAQLLDSTARHRQSDTAVTVVAACAANGAKALRVGLLSRSNSDLERLCSMVALQEELDWLCYRLYGIVQEAEVREPDELLPLRPGHRSFEFALAERDGTVRATLAHGGEVNEEPTAWFDRHGWQPCADIENITDDRTRLLVAQRLQLTKQSRELALIESPTHKRRWYKPDYAAEEQEALRTWLLDRLETHAQTDVRQPFTVRDAADVLQHDPAVQAVAEVLSGSADFDLARLLTDLALTDAVPHVAALRYTDSGLEKRAEWEKTWDLQRREDAGETLAIPVPPKYGSGDFKSATYWSLRGKLDVPKERFVHFPGAGRDDDPSPVLLWAGADHLQRALALAGLFHDRQQNEGWPPERLVPLLAGLDELVPWLKQWHDEPDPARGGQRMGAYFERFVEEESRRLGKTVADLREWRPEAKGRGRKKA